jgi:hypothetical protein
MIVAEEDQILVTIEIDQPDPKDNVETKTALSRVLAPLEPGLPVLHAQQANQKAIAKNANASRYKGLLPQNHSRTR